MFKAFIGSALVPLLTATFIAAAAFSPSVSAASEATVSENYGKTPLVFEPNQGQTDERVKFLSRGQGYSLFLTESEAVLSLQGADDKSQTLRMKLLGAEAAPKITGLERLPGVSNYFIGRDRSKWRAGVPHYAMVGYEGIYSGIDLVFYGTSQRRLEYDFVVAPGADPSRIALSFEGAERLEIDAKGDLVAHLAAGEVRFLKPVIYQDENGKRQDVEGKYTLTDGNRVGFQVASYNPNKPLVIDPVLAYATYLGGTDIEQYVRAIALDSAGNAHITGRTRSTDFPVVNAIQQTCTVPEDGGCFDVFVAKLNSDGSDLIYSTYLGAGSVDRGIAVDSNDNAYVVGGGSNTPTTPGAFQEIGPGGFFVKLDPDGRLKYGTYLDSGASAVAVDSMYRAVIVGQVGPDSDDFLTTEGAFDRTCGDDIDVTDCNHAIGDGFLVVINPVSSGVDDLVYSTFLGGASDDHVSSVAADGDGLVYLIGYTKSSDFPTTAGALQEASLSLDLSAVFTVINPAGNGPDDLFYSTYLGGDGRTIGRDVDIKPGCTSPCRAYLTGDTFADTFPTTLNSVVPFPVTGYETFVSLIDPAGTGSADLSYSTFFGGTGGWAIAAGSDGKVYVSGQVNGSLPTRDAIQGVNRGRGDAFVAVIDPAINGLDGLLFADYLGGTYTETGRAIAVGGSGTKDDPFSVYMAGKTYSPDFPTNAEAFQPELRTPKKKKGRPTEQAIVPDAYFAKIKGPFDAKGPVVDAPTNFKPIAMADIYTAEENVPLIVPVVPNETDLGLLANDWDPDSYPSALVVSGNNDPDNGTVIVYADGSFEYTPDPGFFGTETFLYGASDGQDSDIATVTIEVVSPSNHLPVAGDDLYAASFAPDFLAIKGKKVIVQAPGVLGNDQDADGDSLTAGLLSPEPPREFPEDFVLMPDGGFTYTPNVAGTVWFTYQAEDGNGVSNPATVTIVVSDGTMHIGALNGISWGPKAGFYWIGRVNVVLHQGGGSEDIVADGVTVQFDWLDDLGNMGTLVCITNRNGGCSVENTFDRPVSEATFTVTAVSNNGTVLTYKQEDNHDTEDGTSVTLFKSKIWCFSC